MCCWILFCSLFGFPKQNSRDKKGVNSVVCTLLCLPFPCIFILDTRLFTWVERKMAKSVARQKVK